MLKKVFGCVVAAAWVTMADTIVEDVKSKGHYLVSQFWTALTASELTSILSGDGPYTVFAPANSAFGFAQGEDCPAARAQRGRVGECENKYPSHLSLRFWPNMWGVLDGLLLAENKAKLVEIMKYHVVSGTVLRKDLVREENCTDRVEYVFGTGRRCTGSQNLTTLQGQKVSIRTISNGIGNDGIGNDNDIRVSNPDSDWQGAVIESDRLASNGVVHVINAVLVPTGVDLPPPNAYGLIQLDTVTGQWFESRFVTALIAADLAPSACHKGLLSEIDSTVTVFAPTNAAFEALATGVLDDLLLEANKCKLVAVLTYHILLTKVLSTDLVASQIPETFQGQTLSVLKDGSNVTVNGATVIVADRLASNGVVHIIDAVLMPPGVGSITGTCIRICTKAGIGSGDYGVGVGGIGVGGGGGGVGSSGVSGSSSSGSIAGVAALALACSLLTV